jgi:Flp pilus assembly protein TadD
MSFLDGTGFMASHRHSERTSSHRSSWMISLALAGWTFLVYSPLLQADFIQLDDNLYVTENPLVRSGLSWSGIVTAFTTVFHGLWIPLTRISFMIDHAAWGLNPTGYHATNILFHIGNTLVVFAAVRALSHRPWRSAFTAALFALHPLRVESVAWITERKDVLSAFFVLVALWAYAHYARRPSIRRYTWVLVAFLFGLMSKPMVVTFPVLLLVLDAWPLNRWRRSDGRLSARPLIEKLPLFALAACVSGVTLLSHEKSLAPFESSTIGARLINAVVSNASYLKNTFWPTGLAVFYPHPGSHQAIGGIVISVVVLLTITVVTLRLRGSRPYLLAGWLWYSVALLPVVGIIQFGSHARADRFTYIPLLGIFFALTWFAADLGTKSRSGRASLAAGAGLILVALSATTWVYVGYWRDSVTLFERALSVTEKNYLIHNNYSAALMRRGRMVEAMEEVRRALEIRPEFAEAHNNFGVLLAMSGRVPEAVGEFRSAIRIDPDYADPYNNLGLAHAKASDWSEAIRYYREALRKKPEYADAHSNLGAALARQGRSALAVDHLRQALRIRPNDAKAHNNLGSLLLQMGEVDQALVHFREAIRIQPAYELAHENLRRAMAKESSRSTERPQPD